MKLKALILSVLRRRGRLDHNQISDIIQVPPWRTCIYLNNLERGGHVRCIRKSTRGRKPIPGVWEANPVAWEVTR